MIAYLLLTFRPCSPPSVWRRTGMATNILGDRGRLLVSLPFFTSWASGISTNQTCSIGKKNSDWKAPIVH
jgi:hypothetical protein